ncbi:MAG: hypothetical protein B7Z10_06360 [Rhodobacterales bacterium 32-66-7]|nr:MAG: hypothetical protein B7Z31_09835 [Rhodobacterales bacterium 12-65-15]OYX25438.1 MAG: hypothetical protein B7Z10_06360 [Rhodobacterales bacterium 32-66-7]
MAIRSAEDVWDFVKIVKAEADRDRIISVAAGVAFYALLAVVPALTALISIYGLVSSPGDVPGQLASFSAVLPEEAAILITEQATRIAATANDTLSLTALVSLAIALWSANGGTKALIEALGIAYDVQEFRGFVRLNLVSLAFTLGAVLTVILLAAVVAVLPFVLERLGGAAETLVLVLRWPVIIALLLLGVAVLYRYAPNRSDAAWVWISPGAVVAVLGIVLGSAALGWYVRNFGSYDETYGSLAAVVILMLWLWVSTLMLLLGAEINAELDRQAKARSPA